MNFILPGMGADSRMYTDFSPWQELEDTVFIDWPSWEGENDLTSVARKIIDTHKIPNQQCIIGSSLGGMVALEIAKLADAKCVILLGSAEEKEEINSLLLSLSPLASVTPVKLIQVLTGKYKSRFLEMFRNIDPDFIKHMCLVIKFWPGKESFDRIFRIHGSKDKVIFQPESCRLIEGGGHLIAMTHPEECVSFIKEILEQV